MCHLCFDLFLLLFRLAFLLSLSYYISTHVWNFSYHYNFFATRYTDLKFQSGTKISIEIEAFAIEINLRKVKWLLVCSYNPNFCNLPVHLNAIDKALEFYSKTYDKILIDEILMR